MPIELSNDEKQLIVNVLNQVSLPVSQAQKVLDLIAKLKVEEQPEATEGN